MPRLPFEDSRRLTGANLFFATTGAVLEVVGLALDADLLAGWRARIERAAARLGWPRPQSVDRTHAAGTSLAITAPSDQLLLATEINEWALCAALLGRDPVRWQHLPGMLVAAAADAADAQVAPDPPPVIEESAALQRFEQLAALESKPRLGALLGAADSRGLATILDDTDLTLGSGASSRTFPLTALPLQAAVRWHELRGVPTALVTGSNGKTTTVRLLAACARAHGWRTGYNCTDGVFLDDTALETGDYSGPAGARRVLRERHTEAAILETARGGLLRRGLAVSRADTAVVTNVSADHFGEYGIDDLDGLADTKLVVAAVVAADGLLVLNAEDAHLRAGATLIERRFGRCPPLGWFARDADHEVLRGHRAAGRPTCGMRGGHLWLDYAGLEHDLGAIAAMPLTVNGLADYNVANLAGAALAAAALGIPAATMTAVFAHFGSTRSDNPGRMMRFDLNGFTALVDYAHNPDGLAGLLAVADGLRGARGRLGLLLGQAGNRKNADLLAVARVAARFRPELIVVKENESQLRGRAPGEVPRLIRAELLSLGLPESALPVCTSEVEAAHRALEWARPGDVLALPLHSRAARSTIVTWLEQRSGDSGASSAVVREARSVQDDAKPDAEEPRDGSFHGRS